MENEEFENEKVERCIYNLLVAVGVNPLQNRFKETPKRVTNMLKEMLEGLQYTNKQIAQMYGKTFACDTEQIIAVKNIECFSLCEHHLALMYNMKIDVGYIPDGKVIGLSKIPRIVQMCCKRLQLQERIGEDIAEVIQIATGSKHVIVKISANHACVAARGIKSNNKTVTLTTKGVFTIQKYINRFLKMK